jgi:hypothetical protein
MNALDGKKAMMNFLRKTFLWILLLPTAIGGLGAVSNQLVLIANHDRFPVMINTAEYRTLSLKEFVAYEEAVERASDPAEKVQSRRAAAITAAEIKIMYEEKMLDERHCIMTSETHLNALADVFDFHDGTYSIGDELLELGEWLGAFCVFIWGYIVVDKLRKTA